MPATSTSGPTGYQHYDRSKIIEESIPGLPAPVINGDTGQKIQYLRTLTTNKPRFTEIIDAEDYKLRNLLRRSS